MATLAKRIQLLKGLIHGEVAYTGPFYADIDVTSRCNLRCLGCPYHSSKTRGPSSGVRVMTDMSFELVERLCEELPKLGTREVIVTGEGEPFLHPRLFDIISSFKHAGCKVQLYTNGTLINEPNAALLLDSGLDVLRVSLWANSAEEYEKCYSGAQKFREVTDGVRMVTALKVERQTTLPTVILTGPLNRYNYKSINERIDLVHQVGCDSVAFTAYKHWRGEFTSAALSTEEIDTLCKELAQAKKLLESLSLGHNIDELLLRYRVGEAVWLDLPCYAGWFHTRIRFDGTVMPCCQCYLPLGSLNESSFEEIWNGSEYRAFRRKSLTTTGLASLDQYCDCNWCHIVKDNSRIHRFFQWVAPIIGKSS